MLGNVKAHIVSDEEGRASQQKQCQQRQELALSQAGATVIPSLLSSHLIRVPACRCSHYWRVTHTLMLPTEQIREYLRVVSMLLVIGQLVVVSAFAFSTSLWKTHTCLVHAGAGCCKVTHLTLRSHLEWYIFNTPERRCLLKDTQLVKGRAGL